MLGVSKRGKVSTNNWTLIRVCASVSYLEQNVNTVVCFWKVLVWPVAILNLWVFSVVWVKNPWLGVSDPGLAWIMTGQCTGKCQAAESGFLVCCSLPRSIRSFHHCFGIDLRPNVVSVDRGLVDWQVRLAVIWIKDNPSSTAPDKPWGRSIKLWDTIVQTCFSSQMYTTRDVYIKDYVPGGICVGPKTFPFPFEDLLCSTAANLLLVLYKSTQTVGVIAMPKPLKGELPKKSKVHVLVPLTCGAIYPSIADKRLAYQAKLS